MPILSVVIGRDLAARAAGLIAPLGLGSRVTVVVDPATKRAMGDAVIAALGQKVAVQTFMFDHSPHPDMEQVERVKAAVSDATGVVAVGSGSINDIAKHASHLAGLPFAVFGTAPSMNGYTSVAAAITESGLKKSLASTAARGVFLDLDVLASAPKRLIAAGFGDSICRSTAQSDWLMAHLVRGTPYREAPYMLLKGDEEKLVGSGARLIEGDGDAMEVLARTLVMSGFGMTICGGSYPASQSEHLIAHYIDMVGHNLPQAFYGEHIAITTSTMARLQERVLAAPHLVALPSRDTPQSFEYDLGSNLGRTCWQAFAPKYLDPAQAAELNRVLDTRWPEIRARVRAVMRPAQEIVSALRIVRAPTTPADVGIPAGFYRAALLNARKIRDRFGILDLAEAAGMLDAFVADEAPLEAS